jgi:hypothetical protein
METVTGGDRKVGDAAGTRPHARGLDLRTAHGQRGQSGEDDIEENVALHEQIERVVVHPDPPH